MDRAVESALASASRRRLAPVDAHLGASNERANTDAEAVGAQGHFSGTLIDVRTSFSLRQDGSLDG